MGTGFRKAQKNGGVPGKEGEEDRTLVPAGNRGNGLSPVPVFDAGRNL